MAKTHQLQWLIAGVAAQVRNKILGAARVERVMLAHGDSLAEQRIKEQRELWEYYAKVPPPPPFPVLTGQVSSLPSY
jgi:hypothetical protein